MKWSSEQKVAVISQYWDRGEARCPLDNARLDITARSYPRGYLLGIGCPVCCDRLCLGVEDDPRWKTFRSWTEAEVGALVAEYIKTGSAKCPVCSTNPKIERNQSTVGILCPRCCNLRVEDLRQRQESSNSNWCLSKERIAVQPHLGGRYPSNGLIPP